MIAHEIKLKKRKKNKRKIIIAKLFIRRQTILTKKPIIFLIFESVNNKILWTKLIPYWPYNRIYLINIAILECKLVVSLYDKLAGV